MQYSKTIRLKHRTMESNKNSVRIYHVNALSTSIGIVEFNEERSKNENY